MIFNYAMRNQWVTRNPAEYVDHARDERPFEEQPLDLDVLTPKEIAALREAAIPATYRDGKLVTNNYRLMISFAVFTGCRMGEILGAAWGHMDWKSGQFHVRRTYEEGQFQKPKTRTSYRRLTLPTFLLNELKVWRGRRPSIEVNGTRQRSDHAEYLQPHDSARARSERRSVGLIGIWKQNGNK